MNTKSKNSSKNGPQKPQLDSKSSLWYAPFLSNRENTSTDSWTNEVVYGWGVQEIFTLHVTILQAS